jgi:dUTP pyrophosphatase
MREILAVRRESRTALLPRRATEHSIGYDVFADIPDHPNGLIIPPGQRKLIPLGFSLACPFHTYGRLAPRSGLAVKEGVHVMAGVIDPDYRGEVKVLLLNTSDQPVTILHATRVAQLILEVARVLPVEEREEPWAVTQRGAQGFGSTGT